MILAVIHLLARIALLVILDFYSCGETQVYTLTVRTVWFELNMLTQYKPYITIIIIFMYCKLSYVCIIVIIINNWII